MRLKGPGRVLPHARTAVFLVSPQCLSLRASSDEGRKTAALLALSPRRSATWHLGLLTGWSLFGTTVPLTPLPASILVRMRTFVPQASEKRRRTRINDRLQQLRDVVPTPQEGSNTGDFLGHVLTYVTQLQALAGVQPKQPLPTSGSGSGAPTPAAVVDAATPAGAKAAAGNPRGTEAVDVPPAAGGTRLKRARTRKGT